MLIIVENNANICYDVQAETLEYIWPKMTVYGSETAFTVEGAQGCTASLRVNLQFSFLID